VLLSSITISNYKSYLEAQTVEVGRGFNIFLGANNSGKTTMLEALDLQLASKNLHRSIWNLPAYEDQPSGESNLVVSIQTSFHEIRDLANSRVSFPVNSNFSDNLIRTSMQGIESAFFAKLNDMPDMSIKIQYSQLNEKISVGTVMGETSFYQIGGGEMTTAFWMQKNGSKDDQPTFGLTNQLPTEDMRLGNLFKKFFYRFSAQRNPAIYSGFSTATAVLERDASNLAFCLSQLQLKDSSGHRTLCEWVHRVFPSVYWVQAPAISSNEWQIQCLPRAPDERRGDLAITLDQMGTGIGNVIAILYIVLVSRRPQVIAIDEPNSFLHPKAVRELLNILATEGSKHQYILTAHSPDVLTAINPSKITVFSASDGRTRVRQVDGAQIKDLRSDLSDLGIRMTDLHGRDRVLWVEGQTEELVIPDLLQKFCPTVAAGTAVLRVEHTGTFEKKGVSVTEVADIYTRLSQASALVPPMVAILLDREGRTDEESTRLMEKCNGALFLLDRPMLEDYVMNANAIAARLNKLGESCTSDQVQEKIDSPTKNETAAKMLARIFSDLSEARHEFQKTRDVPALISWILEHDPNYLSPLGTCLEKIFQSSGKDFAV
jgi:predicted ATPase